jgi:hypothetical protein
VQPYQQVNAEYLLPEGRKRNRRGPNLPFPVVEYTPPAQRARYDLVAKTNAYLATKVSDALQNAEGSYQRSSSWDEP